VEEKKIYQISFLVRNLTERVLRIKFTQPKFLFKVECNAPLHIAPGLSLSAQVIFKAEIIEEVFEKFFVLTEDSKTEIPISVFPPSPFIVFTPYIDFGFVE
jgi:hypothetical protein